MRLYFLTKRLLLWMDAPFNEGIVLSHLLLSREMPAHCNLMERKGKLYTHCGSGKGHSAKNVEEAERMPRQKRLCVRLHPVQRELVRMHCKGEISVGVPHTLPEFDVLP